MDGWAPFILFILIIGAGWAYSFTSLAGERVGEIRGEPGPLGRTGRSISIDVRRTCAGGTLPNLTVMVRSPPSIFTPKFPAEQAAAFADGLVAAALEAMRPDAHDRRELSRHEIANERITLGTLRKDSLGYVVFQYGDGEFGTISCLSPGDCESLALEIRIASQPGKDLEAATRRWWHLEESRQAREAAGPPATG